MFDCSSFGGHIPSHTTVTNRHRQPHTHTVTYQVAEVLNNSKPALARRFAIISKRAQKPDNRRKMPLAEGAILVDTLIDDFKQARNGV